MFTQHTDTTVEVVGSMGDDLWVVNAARVSFGSQSKKLTERDEKLISYLANHYHDSPFRHCHLSLRIVAPEFVMRQLYKHVVGIEMTSVHPCKDHAWSEISGRFKELHNVYVPSTFRTQHSTAKQCSGPPLDDQAKAREIFNQAMVDLHNHYTALLDLGVSREQARMILPLNFMTEVLWTASLQAIFHFVKLRNHPDSQPEIAELASKISTIAKQHFPVSWKALTDREIVNKHDEV